MKLHQIVATAAFSIITPFLAAQGAQAKPATPAAKQPTAVTKAAASNTGSSAPLDINTATPDQLKQLPGVGDAFSKRIIDGRPYTAKNQLMSRGILPKATYEGIAGQIIAKRPAK